MSLAMSSSAAIITLPRSLVTERCLALQRRCMTMH